MRIIGDIIPSTPLHKDQQWTEINTDFAVAGTKKYWTIYLILSRSLVQLFIHSITNYTLLSRALQYNTKRDRAHSVHANSLLNWLPPSVYCRGKLFGIAKNLRISRLPDHLDTIANARRRSELNAQQNDWLWCLANWCRTMRAAN